MAQEPVRVTVEVSGGVVVGVYGGRFVEVLVYDHDDAGANPDYRPAVFVPDPEVKADLKVLAAWRTADRIETVKA